MVWCLMSHRIWNVENGAEVEMEAIHETIVGDGQDRLHRSQEETIVREDRGAGAERDVLVEKGDCNY